MADASSEYARWVLAPPKPAAASRPTRSYLVCGTPRSGSWFLCGLLASTGIAGRPHEWFWRDTQASAMRAWGAEDIATYHELVLAAGTTPNGVFGAKVMWASFGEFLAALPAPLESVFPEPRFVWMRRSDRLAQAVSFAKAVQTGHWYDWDPAPGKEPAFDFESIDALLRELDEHERGWAGWFSNQSVDPLLVVYEQLVAEPEAETRRVLDYLSLRLPDDASIRPLTHRQSDQVNAEWRALYRATAASRPGR